MQLRSWMRRASTILVAVCLVSMFTDPSLAGRRGGSRWGANYFPNVELITHEGKKVRFFDDLIKDKVVAINFIYTSCPDSCPLETARLANVQRILQDRMGRDVFFYSISIDPEVDTPEVLAAYVEKFQVGPGWTFLTGNEDDIVLLRKKLGLYIAEINQDDSNDHNLSLIIGNQATGRWMKRSPFENPYFLAEQIGGWLHNWKTPKDTDYASAPELRSISTGELLFRTRCEACHTVGGGDVARDVRRVGPDLLGVTDKRDRAWLERWLKEPEKMLEEKDPIASALFDQYAGVTMPNMRLTDVDVVRLLDYLSEESSRVLRTRGEEAMTASNTEAEEGEKPCCAKHKDDEAMIADAAPAAEENEAEESGVSGASMLLSGLLGGVLCLLAAAFKWRASLPF